MKKQMKKHKYISRIQNSKNSGAWIVRIHGFPCKTFSFNKNGGERKAFGLAKKWIKDILKQENKLNYLKVKTIHTHQQTHIKNTSGILGVFLGYTKSDYPGWICSYMYNNKQRHRSFSTNKYGYEKAFLMACELRAYKLGTLVVVEKDKLPVTIRRLKSYLKNTITDIKVNG